MRYIVKTALLCRFLQNGGSPPTCFLQIGGLPLYTAERYSDIITITKYSLQGTTQGNGLTGADMPVRFSM